MIVMKFGGTSLGDSERITHVGKIITKHLDRNPLIVVSAIGDVTDLLLEAVKKAGQGQVEFDAIHDKHYKIIEDLSLDETAFSLDFDDMKRILMGISYLREVSPRVEDMFVSFGERLSAKILARYLTLQGTEARMFPAYDCGLITDSTYGNAKVLNESYDAIRLNMKDVHEVPVVTGFIGKDRDGNITTLGRGGSDYTASIFGAALNAEEIWIWTDVTGIMTADPAVISEAGSIGHLSFREAGELAYYGARVLHPATIMPAMKKGIRVRVLNTFAPDQPGTTITEHAVSHEKGVKSIAYKENQALIHIDSARMFMAYGFLAKIADIFARYRVILDMISTSETTVSLTAAPGQDIEPALKEIEEFADFEVDYGKTILCVVGEGIPGVGNVASRMLSVLEKANIILEMISQAKIGINISVLINDEDIDKAVKVLHKEFFPE